LWPFSKSDAAPVRREEREPALKLSNPDTITRPEQIARVLEQLYEQRCVLGVSLDGSDEYYSSAVIEVVRKENYLVIDELTPRVVNKFIHPQRPLAVRARMNNVTIRFETEVSGVGEEAGLPYYQLRFPAVLDYIQRREHYRAGVPMEKQVPVQLAMPSGTLYTAELRDISMGGLSARLRGATPAELAPGSEIQHLVISLPSGARIHGSGLICYADVVQASRISRCGVRFTHVDRTDQHALEQFIAQLDREMKRKRLA
jgi:c-di-GMP-binding flagellar brake protein YcgR